MGRFRANPALLPALIALGAGLAGGLLIWLWFSHGATVYLHYLAGAAFPCI